MKPQSLGMSIVACLFATAFGVAIGIEMAPSAQVAKSNEYARMLGIAERATYEQKLAVEQTACKANADHAQRTWDEAAQAYSANILGLRAQLTAHGVTPLVLKP